MTPAEISNGSPRAASFSLASARTAASIASRASSALLRRSPLDGSADMRGPLPLHANQRESAKPRSPLKRSIPEFPTKVGGHHMSGSTDPARDSSLKDR